MAEDHNIDLIGLQHMVERFKHISFVVAIGEDIANHSVLRLFHRLRLIFFVVKKPIHSSRFFSGDIFISFFKILPIE